MSAERKTQIEQLSGLLTDFARERDWEQFHTPKNLAMAISGEAGELLEIFQWATPDEAVALVAQKKVAIEHEVADIFAYLLRFCAVAEVDLDAALRAKIALNAKKYPAEQVRGKSKKYSEY